MGSMDVTRNRAAGRRRPRWWALGAPALWCLTNLVGGCGGATIEARPEPIDRFECQTTPLDDYTASRYTERALPGVWKVLEDTSKRSCWNQALVVSGRVGGPDAFARLRGFIESRSQTLALSEEFMYLQTGFQAIADIARRGRNARSASLALDYLIESTESAVWLKRTVNWKLDKVITREIIRVMTSSAIKALGAVTQANPEIMLHDTDRAERDAWYERRNQAEEHMLMLASDAVEQRAMRFKYQETDAPTDIISQMINLHVLPPGRVAYAMSEALIRMRERDNNSLRNEASQLRASALKVFADEQAWLAARKGEEAWLRTVADANALADVRLNGLHGQLRSLRDLLDGAEDKAAIVRVEQTIFPDGPLAVIDADMPEQAQFVLAACAELEDKLKQDLKRLKLQNHVLITRKAHEDLDRALRSGIGGQGYEYVIRARAQLQNDLRVLAARIVARFPGTDPKDRETRDHTLEPVLNQDEQVASFLARRVPVRDVNPETGQELDPLEEGGFIDRSKTPGLGDAELLRQQIRGGARGAPGPGDPPPPPPPPPPTSGEGESLSPPM